MRACLEALEDKFLPSLVADAEGEVAAAIKRISRILTVEMDSQREKQRYSALPKYLPERTTGAGFGRVKPSGHNRKIRSSPAAFSGLSNGPERYGFLPAPS